MSVSIQNRQRRVPVSSTRLRMLATRARSAVGGSDRDVHVTVVDDREIRRLNRRYLGARRPTDVLAFNLELGAGTRASPHPLGEVIISGETAQFVPCSAEIGIISAKPTPSTSWEARPMSRRARTAGR